MSGTKSTTVGVLAHALAAAPMGLLLVGGAIKLHSIDAFAEAIQTWTIISESIRSVVVMFLPPVEFVVGAAWFIGVCRRTALASALVLYVLFTAALGWQLATASAPDCGCLGQIKLFNDARTEARFALVRNIVCLVLLVSACFIVRHTASKSIVDGSGGRSLAL